jgi:hypothetical protein
MLSDRSRPSAAALLASENVAAIGINSHRRIIPRFLSKSGLQACYLSKVKGFLEAY